MNKFLDDSFVSLDTFVKSDPRPKEAEIENKVKKIISEMDKCIKDVNKTNKELKTWDLLALTFPVIGFRLGTLSGTTRNPYLRTTAFLAYLGVIGMFVLNHNSLPS